MLQNDAFHLFIKSVLISITVCENYGIDMAIIILDYVKWYASIVRFLMMVI